MICSTPDLKLSDSTSFVCARAQEKTKRNAKNIKKRFNRLIKSGFNDVRGAKISKFQFSGIILNTIFRYPIIQTQPIMKNRNISHTHEEAKIYQDYYKPSLNVFRLLKSVLSV